MALIQIRRLRKEYVERRAYRRDLADPHVPYGGINLVLDDINLEFADGEMACILGPSGCGKSTLLRIIAGFEKPTSGLITIDGKETNPKANHVFIFQHNSLFPWMTIRQNIEMGAGRMGNKEEKREKVTRFLKMADLEPFRHKYPHQISLGMKRRAEIARALISDPSILFLDEPFANLDFLTHMKMRQEIVGLHQRIGMTVLLVTHDVNDALAMGDSVVLLSRSPARVKMELKLDFPHPREIERHSELPSLREKIISTLCEGSSHPMQV